MSESSTFPRGPRRCRSRFCEQARDEMLDYQGSGMSVMEMSHRSKEFVEHCRDAPADLASCSRARRLRRFCFCRVGQRCSFRMVPLNLLGDKTSADYLHTGSWSAKAIKKPGDSVTSTWWPAAKAATLAMCPR